MNRSTARLPIRRPCFTPSSVALRKWNPTKIRERAFSFAAWEKLVNDRVPEYTSSHVLPAGIVRLQVSKLMSSVPKNRRMTCAATPPSTLCAES